MGDVDGLNAELQHELERMRQRIADLEASHGADQERTAQDTAQHNDLRFRLFYEQAPLPYQSLDEGGHLLDVNPAWLALFHYRRDQVIGRWFGELLTPASREHLAKNFPRFKVAGEVHGVEFDVLCGDGVTRTVSFEGRIGYDEEGHFKQTHCICVDLTAYKANVAKQRQAEERVRRLLDQQIIINNLAMALGDAPQLDTIYRTIHEHVSALMDTHAFIVASYSAAQKQFRARYVISEGQACDVSRFPPVPLEPVGKGTQSQVVHTGEPVYLPDLRAVLSETPSQHTIMNDGSVVKGPPPQDKPSSRSALLVPMKMRGEIVGVLQVQSTRLDAYSPDDITLLAGLANVAAVAIQNATLHAETAQRAERLAMVNRIARAVGSILQVDDLLATVYREVSAIFQTDAFLIALYDEQTQELDFRLQVEDQTTIPPERCPLGKGLMSHVVVTGQPLLIRDSTDSYPEPILWGTGPDTPSWLGAPMRIGNRVIGAISVQSYQAYAYDEDDQTLLGTIADQVAIAIENARLYEALQSELRERQRLEEQLLQAQKMEAIGRLAGGVAHDFNNLLTVINGYSQLILSNLEPGAPLRQDIKEIAQAGERAATLTRQLLAFSRRQMMEMRVLDLNQVLEGMGRMLQRIIGEDMRLEMHLSRPMYSIKADPGQIEQVVVNLAANARDAMPAGGALVIETRAITLDDEYTANHLDVQPGDYALLVISDTGHGMSPEVREHLFEPFFTTKGVGQGTGLGLATVYGIVKQLGGNIQVYSEVGLGTSFKIYLPRCDETPPPPSETPPPLPHGHETILIIEDEDEVRRLAERLLQRLGYTVIEAGDLDRALEALLASQNKIDLALVDVVMPQASGPDVAAQLRKIYPDLRVLYMSGYTDRAIAHHGLLEPNTPLLQKPFTVEQIALQVRQALASPA